MTQAISHQHSASKSSARLTSSFFSSTDRRSFPLFTIFVGSLGDSLTGAKEDGGRLSDGIRLDALSGEARFGDEADEGRPRVSPAGKARCGLDGLRWLSTGLGFEGGARDCRRSCLTGTGGAGGRPEKWD